MSGKNVGFRDKSKVRHNVVLTLKEGERLQRYLRSHNLKNVSQLVKKVISSSDSGEME